VKQKRPQIGDLVRITFNEVPTDHIGKIGIVVGHYGIRSQIEWTDGTYSEPMRAALEVL
jgi:hypothetical protein